MTLEESDETPASGGGPPGGGGADAERIGPGRMNPFPTAEEYAELSRRMRADPDWSNGYAWAQGLRRPADAETMAGEIIWVMCNSGMKESVARLIHGRVREALLAGNSASSAFGHKGKAAAMDAIWRDRARLFAECAALADAELVEWCGRLPWIGGITKYHAAKNLGADVAKPDRWLERLATRAGTDVDALCARLAHASGDRIATVDLVLWWGCAKGAVAVPDDGGRPRLLPARAAA